MYRKHLYLLINKEYSYKNLTNKEYIKTAGSVALSEIIDTFV